MHSCEFCKNFRINKNDYLVHVWTTASDIMGYPYVAVSCARSTLKKCTVFCCILVFIHFKLILESWCRNSPVMIFGKVLRTILQPRCLIFIHFLRLDTWMNIWTFCFSSESVNQKFFFTWRKSKILYDILLVSKPVALYWNIMEFRNIHIFIW